MAVLAVWDSMLTSVLAEHVLAGASASGRSGCRQPLGAAEGSNIERAGRGGPAAVALGANRQPLAMGMARPPRRAAQLAAKGHSA
jgi:hypothetical protein